MNKLKLILFSIFIMAVSSFATVKSLPLSGLSLDTRANSMANGLSGELMNNTSFVFHPAAWQDTTKINYAVSYINWIEGMQGGSVSTVVPLKNKNLGINATYLDLGKISSYDINNVLLGTTQSFFFALKGNLSFPYKNFFVGAGSTFYLEKIADESILYFNLDAAFVWLLSNNFGFGFKMKDLNILLKTDTLFQTGFYYHSTRNIKTVTAFNFSGDYSMKISGEQNLHFGMEYIYKKLSLRAGYIFSIGDYKTSRGLFMGFGINIKKYAFDFSYTPISGMDAPIQMTIRTSF